VSGPLTVLVADDHAPTRAGVRGALAEDGFVVVAEAPNADAAVDGALRERPDVCVLDIEMPGSGIVAAARISEQLPATAVVMLTVSRDDEHLFASLRAGAVGYLLKDMDPSRLGAALRGVLGGEAALPRTLVARLIGEFRSVERRPSLPFVRERGAKLTPREWEVLQLLRDGMTTAAIAHRLGVADVTVRRHVSAILAKLRLPDRKAMARLFEEERAAR
jgi:two-component system, NarL family, nitrate/nitrite response regulator NarL